MSALSEPDGSAIGQPDADAAPHAQDLGGEQRERLPVLAGQLAIARPRAQGAELGPTWGSPGTLAPVVQAAAAAAGGFLAGAAVVGLAQRRKTRALAGTRRGRRLGRRRAQGRASPRAAELVQIVGSRSLLVDVHLLGGRD